RLRILDRPVNEPRRPGVRPTPSAAPWRGPTALRRCRPASDGARRTAERGGNRVVSNSPSIRNLPDAVEQRGERTLATTPGARRNGARDVPDLRSILRTFTPAHAVRNSRRELDEQQRIHAEIDALASRLDS